MPLGEYSYYVTLLPCNQFHWGAQGGRVLTGGPCPLATPKNRLWFKWHSWCTYTNRRV